MAGKTKRAALVLMEDQKKMLKELSRSRTAPAREIERAKILIDYADGISITGLQRQIGVGRPAIYRCIDKALAAGVQRGLKDTYHRPHKPEISDEARAWVASITCH
ncbi:Helix-turn-helix domain-containing protein [Nitrosomonas sp. Nm132]|nr:Helix-turn-helix domain-containing protein [Nitrosomonas sp. Nm132]